MIELTKDQERAFIIELTALTRKHGISIEGCGCCNSPRLEAADTSDERSGYSNYDHLQWVAPSNKWGWEREKARIVGAEPPPAPAIQHACKDATWIADPSSDSPYRCRCSECGMTIPTTKE